MKLPNIKPIIPSGTQVLREGLIVLGGILIAAWILNQFPALKKYVGDASITVKDQNNNTIF